MLFFSLMRAKKAPVRRASDLGAAVERAAVLSVDDLFCKYRTGFCGISHKTASDLRERLGANVVTQQKPRPVVLRFLSCFVSPFTLVLIALAVVSFVADVWLAAPDARDASTVVIIATMVLVSGLLDFYQSEHGQSEASALANSVDATCCVVRTDDGDAGREVPFEDLVAGDVVRLVAGDMLPADCRIVTAKDLFVNQAALTGESEPVEKTAAALEEEPSALLDCANIAFSGTTVESGSGLAVVVATGDDTYVGRMSSQLRMPAEASAFDEGLARVSRVLVGFMLVMCPIVFAVNGITKGNWLDALLFSISVAVGITPQMLPVIVSTCLASGARQMARRKAIVKTPSAVQNLGAMDVLCCDKTGTLTEDQVVLERHLDVLGNDDARVLRHAFLNSWFQTGLKNLIDRAVIARTDELLDGSGMRAAYVKVDEIPFDFERRLMSVVVEDAAGKRQMVTKGAVEEVLGACSHVEVGERVLELTAELCDMVRDRVAQLNAQGMRVVGVAQKTDPRPAGEFGIADEQGMVLMGYLGFLDPPKASAADAVAQLEAKGVTVKVLTGDNDGVAATVCRAVGIDARDMLLGSDIDALSDDDLALRAEQTHVFAKLSPLQKARVVSALRAGAGTSGHVVGFMGDGINDAAAMRAADVGISVDTAVDVAKESADIVLMQKDLKVLAEGVREGRRTYGNTIKYIKATASSNLGNVLSVMVASVFLPFLPMSALQLLLLGLAYTVCCVGIPWDRVDDSFLVRPRAWDASSVTGFMLVFGPVSSVFDVLTFVIAFFAVAPAVAGGSWQTLTAAGNVQALATFAAAFQTAWFVESMWTQTMVLHVLRSEKIPVVGSRAAGSFTAVTVAGTVAITLLPYMPGAAAALGLVALPAWYIVIVAALMVAYVVAVSVLKRLYVSRTGSLL